MTGHASAEILRDCLFENIAVRVGRGATGSVPEGCQLCGTAMTEVERGIYGGISRGGNEFVMATFFTDAEF